MTKSTPWPDRAAWVGIGVVLCSLAVLAMRLVFSAASASAVVLAATLVGVALVVGGRRAVGKRSIAMQADSSVDPTGSMDSLPVALIDVAMDGHILSATSAAHSLLGRAPMTLPGHPIDEVLPGLPEDWLSTELESRKAPPVHRLKLTHPSGEPSHLDVRSQRCAGSPSRFRLLLTDRGEVEALRAEVEDSRNAARQGQRLQSLGTAVGGIAHDFNNLLAPILGYSEMALAELSEDDPLVEDLQHVRVAAKRAQGLVAQMMRFSRPSDDAIEAVRLHEVASEAAALLRASVPTTVEISTVVDKRTPPVLGTATQLNQVVINLCTNASHAMPAGGTIELRLDVFSPIGVTEGLVLPSGEGPFVRLRVVDDGHGMDRATLEKIFDPFFTTKELGKGTGLGLSSVRSIIAEMGGTISVRSEVGRGTTFTLLFPPASDVSQDSKPSENEATVGEGRIMVVDDEENVLKVTERALAQVGFTVRSFRSSEEAADAFQADPDGFDLLWTDQVMPGYSGTELSRRFRETRPDLPIVLTSGYQEAVSDEDMHRLAPCDFVLKPLSPASIAATAAKKLSG